MAKMSAQIARIYDCDLNLLPQNDTKSLGKLEASIYELRLRKKSAGQLQNLIGATQFLDLTLQCFDALALFTGDAISQACVDLVLLYPIVQRRRCTANLGRYRFYRRPQRRVLTAMLLYQTDCSFFYFGGIFFCFVHGSILSRFGASSKPGAVQSM